MQKIKAGAKTAPGYGNFSLVEIEKPQLRNEDDILFKVTSVGMCGTDVSIYKWTDTVAKEYAPHFPLVLGHEMSGIIIEIGSNVTKFKIGDHIAVNEHIFCGTCEQCLAGRTCICEKRYILGCHINGAMTEYMVVRQQNCFKLPESVPHYAGSIAEPMSVAVHAVERVPANPGDIAVVYGVGTIGLALCIVLLEAGATVIAVGIQNDSMRLKLAEEFGAIPIVIEQEGNQDVLAVLHKLDASGADICYECSGAPNALSSALSIIKPAGVVGQVGMPPINISIDVCGQIVFKEKSVVGIRAFYHSTWDKTMKLLENNSDKAVKLITHCLPLERFSEAIELILSGKAIKVVVCPDSHEFNNIRKQ